jgi:tetratricopeptide (TPR) repeat protein
MKLVAFVLVLASVPAWAQSKKYPAEPVDKDEEEAQKSDLWNQATNPAQAPYQALVKDAQKLLGENRPDATRDAIKKLDEAIPLMPGNADAYRARGDAYMALQDWSKCAADYDAAWSRLMRDADAKNTPELRRRLGLCQARDGKLADAERTLAETAATGVNSVEIWMRLGEVRIAMGKLEGAIAALEAALQQTDIAGHALVRWLLAGAYDRARQPSEARRAAVDALGADRSMSMLKTPTLPLLGVAEESYLLGLAYEAHDPPRPEQALVQFRRFAKLAGDSPWKKRADDHVRELRSARLPDTVERLTGNAPYEEIPMRDTVRKGMPAMRACLAKTPFVVLTVQITKRGPKGPDGARWRAPPDGVAIVPEEINDTTRADTDAAIRCVEPIAQRLALPKPKEKETYYKVQFRVVGP